MRDTFFCGSDGKYSNYRIPGLCVTKRGTLLAYFEARRTSSDWARMDILLFRSEDGGDHFGEPIVMAQGTDSVPTVNNPVCIAGSDGTLHFLFCKNYAVEGGDVCIRHSTDDGVTWSEPESILDSTRPDLHNVFAIGPGHGICLSDGTLLTPIWMVLKSAKVPVTSHGPAVVSTLYSKDNGKTWKLGEVIFPSKTVPDPNETQAAELRDGRILLNVRSTGLGCRAQTVSKNGYSGWEPLTPVPALPDPTCFGSIVRYRQGAEDLILAVNCADTEERRNLTVRASSDMGKIYPEKLTVTEGDAGYADIAVLPDGTVCVLYEVRAGVEDRMAIFERSELH